MNKKLALVALVIALVCAGAWFALQGEPGGRGGSAPAASAPVAEKKESATELAPAPAPESERIEAAPAAAAAPAELPLEHQSFALEGARWIDVSVIVPPGVPLEDRPALVVFTRKDHKKLDQREAHGLSEKLDLSDDFAADVENEHDWARRPLAASVRLPLPREAEGALLFVQSRYLHLDALEFEPETTAALSIEPELGGFVSGHCVFPGGRTAERDDLKVEFDGRAREEGLMGFARPDSRDARVRADLSFELRALSARKKYVVQGRAKGFVPYFELSFVIQPGEHKEVALEFKPGATLAGIVRGEGNPLEGVRVRAGARGGMPLRGDNSTTTAADGTFLIEGISPGKVTLSASKDGWVAKKDEPLELGDGQVVRGIELVLESGQRITGTVLWPDGAPVEGAEVRAVKAREQGWMQELVQTRSDAQGSFVLGGLTDEAVDVVARHAARDSAQAAEPSPSALRHKAVGAEPVRVVETGEETQAWFASQNGVAPAGGALVLTLAPPIEVRGLVLDDTGAPVRSFQLSARPADRPENAPEEAHRSYDVGDAGDEAAPGAFILGVARAGDWILVAQSKDGEQSSEPVTVSVPQSGPELRLVLPRSGTLAGIVVDPSGQPVAEASVSVSDSPQEASFAMFGQDGTPTGADGRFSLTHAAGSAYVGAHHEKWAASEQQPIELAPGESKQDLVLALRVGARISGEVFDAEGKPEAGQNVNCGAGGGMGLGFGGERSTVSDAAGRFVFEHVTPGKITVSALPSEEELLDKLKGAEDESAFLGVLGQMRSKTLEVADGAEAHVVLGAEPKKPVRVFGKVTEAGSPLVSKPVFVFAEGGALLQGMKMARTDEGGRYSVELDRPGDYVFGVGLKESFDGAGTQFYVEVPEVPELEQDFALPLGRIAGRVIAVDGSPAAGVPVRLASSEGLMGIEDLSDSHRASTGADGSFAFQHLTAGSYALHVGSSFFDGSSRDEQRFGRAVIDGIAVKEDHAVDGLVVQLSAPGKLAGLVRDGGGKPVGGVAIFVRDEAGRAISISECTSDASGRFTYSGIAPGRVTASARSDKLACGDSTPIEIRAGATSEVELVVSEGTLLKVSLLENGKEVRARLRVMDESGRRVDDLVSVNEFQGLLAEGFSSRQRRVGPLPPGKYTLIATTLDGKDAKKSVVVEAGQGERHVKLLLR